MTFLILVWYPEWRKNMVLIEAREELSNSDLGGKRVLRDPLFPSPDGLFSHEEILFDRAYCRKGKKAAGGDASQLTLFLFSTLDLKPLTLTTLKKHEGLQKQERRQKRQIEEQVWEDFWASFSPPMDNMTKEED